MMKTIIRTNWKFYFRKTLAVLLAVQILLQPLEAAAIEIIPVNGFHVRNERVQHDNVLVSRPHKMDSKIFDFLVSNKIRTLQDYSRWLTDNIEYHEEAFPDPWIYPEELLTGRRGDCEDYALLTMHVLQVLGFQPKVLALVRIDRNGQVTRSHAICVVKFKTGYLWFDNGELKEAQAGNLQQLAEQLMQEFNYSQTAELNMQKMSWTTLYERA